LGALLTGVFATAAVVPAAKSAQGLVEGNAGQVVNQAVGVAAAIGIAVVGTLIILKVLDAVMGLRVSQQEELQGLDVSQHGEEAYIQSSTVSISSSTGDARLPYAPPHKVPST